MARVKMQALVCDRCEHVWVPRRGRPLPKVCPVCKTTEWDMRGSDGTARGSK